MIFICVTCVTCYSEYLDTGGDYLTCPGICSPCARRQLSEPRLREALVAAEANHRRAMEEIISD